MIRPITREDKDIFLTLTAEFYRSEAVSHTIPPEYHLRTFEELMRSTEYTEAFLLESQSSVVGYALLAKTFSQEAGGLVVWLEELYLLPEFRSRGLGHTFFQYLFEHYADAARFRLEVDADNTGASKLYRSLGFEVFPYRQMVLETPNA